VFPQVIGLAASFNRSAWTMVGYTASTGAENAYVAMPCCTQNDHLYQDRLGTTYRKRLSEKVFSASTELRVGVNTAICLEGAAQRCSGK